MPKIGKHIYKRKDGRWEGRFIKEHVDGKAVYKAVYAHSQSEVREKLAAAIEENKKRICGDKRAGNVSDVGRAWLKDESGNMKETTVNKYEDIMRCYILPVFGDRELSEITNEELASFGRTLLAEGGQKKQGLSSATVSEVITTMNSLRIYALRHDRAVSFTPECVSIRKESAEIRVFSADEQEALVKWLLKNMDLTSLAIMVCLFTGLRLGEICALDWSNINLETGTMRICQNMQRIRVKGDGEHKTQLKVMEPKSKRSVRTIPIPDELKELLAEYRRDEGYLLTGEDGRIVEPRTLQYRFKSILKKCGIEDANFHTTRHTFATRCVERGFEIKCLSEILGHSNVSITLNRYVHPSMDLKQENMKLLSDLIRTDQKGK